MEQYQVTGMSCAACSARVEKAVSGVPGVTACSVSLLTNSMGVEGTASPEEVVRAVEKAGYGAVPKNDRKKRSNGRRTLLGGRRGPQGSRDPEAEKAAAALRAAPSGLDVFFDGARDVGLAGPGGL